MIWFVNPFNAKKAVDLSKITYIEVVYDSIYFNHSLWYTFSNKFEAEEVYENIIRLLQISRYK